MAVMSFMAYLVADWQHRARQKAKTTQCIEKQWNTNRPDQNFHRETCSFPLRRAKKTHPLSAWTLGFPFLSASG
jgi:hypothetical protein